MQERIFQSWLFVERQTILPSAVSNTEASLRWDGEVSLLAAVCLVAKRRHQASVSSLSDWGQQREPGSRMRTRSQELQQTSKSDLHHLQSVNFDPNLNSTPTTDFFCLILPVVVHVKLYRSAPHPPRGTLQYDVSDLFFWIDDILSPIIVTGHSTSKHNDTFHYQH